MRAHCSGLDFEIIVKTTNSSLESFLEVAGRLRPGRALISTVDAYCPADAFLTFVKTAGQFPADATVLAVTPLVDDERPLWASLDASGRVTRMGGDSGDVVTAGMYLVPEQVTRMLPPPAVKSLREFLIWLLERGEPVYAVVLPVVVDVDRAEDISHAEMLARRGDQQRKVRPGGQR